MHISQNQRDDREFFFMGLFGFVKEEKTSVLRNS